MKRHLLILLSAILCICNTYSQTNWELLNPLPTANTGKDIEFVTNHIGYIITSNELLETLNAGSTWSKKQNINSGNDMSFHNSAGYIVGNYGYVLKSTDNGNSWNQISVGFNGSFNTVNIIDTDNIILSTSNSIVKSIDGGNTWDSMNIPNTTVNKTFFTSSLMGHAICDNGIILKTIDGGENWYVTRDDSLITPSEFVTIYFINENIGFVSREHSEMYKTTDAGETWVEVTGSSEIMYDYYFIDENNGFATGEHGATHKTTDGGITWNNIFFQGGYIYNTSMYGIYFQDSNIGYATGARGRIVKTVDGGNTWSHYAITYEDVDQIEFINENIAYILVDNQIFKTTDGGNTLVLLGAPVDGGYTIEISFITENIGYSVSGGETGTSFGARYVYKTTDGGLSWNPTNNGYALTNSNLNYIQFLDENVGFAGGGLFKTTDGGDTWANLNFGLIQVQFIDHNIGFGRSYNKMYKTTDGGITWELSFEPGQAINDLYFVDENNGYFVGDQYIMYKTNDGGTNWEELEVPYDDYTCVNFYSKNVGYIADEDGNLYKTENGGINWQYLTQQFSINSIELISDKIYTAGTYGKIYRSDVEFEELELHVYPAEIITNSSATISGNATSNADLITNIQFEYSADYSFSNTITTTPSMVDMNDSVNFSIDLENLESNTTYYYRLSGVQNSNTEYSQILNFTTLSDYEITTNFGTFNVTATSALVSGNILSNGYDISNVEFQFGISSEALINSTIGSPDFVAGGSSEYIGGSLTGLEPQTQYFYRIKATHLGEEIYGNVQSFTTYPDFSINLNNPSINGTDVTLSAYINAYNQDITDIIFEYGSIDFENNISTIPSQVSANNSENVSATLTNLDINSNYIFRLKAIHDGEYIYSEERVFNFSGDIIMVSGIIEETQDNSLKLSGLINSYGTFLSNIHFEYGLTDSFGSSVEGMPNIAYGNTTHLITAFIDNPIPNQTYYYRIVATNNGNLIYSDTYQFTTSSLSQTDFDLEIGLSIYPNPTKNILNIEATNTIETIEVFNLLGQQILSSKPNTLMEEMNMKTLNSGMYLVKITIGEQTATYKVVKE